MSFHRLFSPYQGEWFLRETPTYFILSRHDSVKLGDCVEVPIDHLENGRKTFMDACCLGEDHFGSSVKGWKIDKNFPIEYLADRIIPETVPPQMLHLL